MRSGGARRRRQTRKPSPDRGIHAIRAAQTDLGKVRLLDCHLVGSGRNQFNTVFGTGGNIGKRNLAKVYGDAVALSAGKIDERLTTGCGRAFRGGWRNPARFGFRWYVVRLREQDV